MLRCITRSEIDEKKWTALVTTSSNGLIYSQLFYLDRMARNSWQALVWGDYQFVMALPFREKFGIRYIYQPAFTQQLGIIGNEITSDIAHAFLEELKKLFSYVDYAFNFSTDQNNLPGKIEHRTNYILLLENTSPVNARFSPSFQRNLKRLKKYSFVYDKEISWSEILQQFRDFNDKAIGSFHNKDWLAFTEVCQHCEYTETLICRATVCDGEMQAGCIILKDEKRLYNLVSFVTEAGKKTRANYFLYYHLLQENAMSNLLFDFEGSDVAGIAAFYERMNPDKEMYPAIHYNKLFPLLRLIKK